jgi:hypothetical protein
MTTVYRTALLADRQRWWNAWINISFLGGRGATMPEDPWTDQSGSVSDSSLWLTVRHLSPHRRILETDIMELPLDGPNTAYTL